MIRRPPRSTPFPTRRSSDLAARFRAHPAKSLPVLNADGGLAGTVSRAELYEWLWMSPVRPAESRSEEHTSELQSQSNLVCRLLLEKKKTNNRNYRSTTILRC